VTFGGRGTTVARLLTIGVMICALANCGTPPSGSTEVKKGSTASGEWRLSSADGSLSVRLPTGWGRRPCPVKDDDCVHAVPGTGGGDAFVDLSFDGMNPIEGNPMSAYCIPGMDPPDLSDLTGPEFPKGWFTRITITGHRAFRLLSGRPHEAGHPPTLTVMVCRDAVPLSPVWLICQLGDHPEQVQRVCDRAVETFVVRG